MTKKEYKLTKESICGNNASKNKRIIIEMGF